MHFLHGPRLSGSSVYCFGQSQSLGSSHRDNASLTALAVGAGGGCLDNGKQKKLIGNKQNICVGWLVGWV